MAAAVKTEVVQCVYQHGRGSVKLGIQILGLSLGKNYYVLLRNLLDLPGVDGARQKDDACHYGDSKSAFLQKENWRDHSYPRHVVRMTNSGMLAQPHVGICQERAWDRPLTDNRDRGPQVALRPSGHSRYAACLRLPRRAFVLDRR